MSTPAAPAGRGVPLLARGRAGALAAHALVVPARPGGLRGGARRVGRDHGRRRSGRCRRLPGDTAPHPSGGVGRPRPVEHAGLPPLPGRGGAARRRPDGRPAVDLGDRPVAQGAERGGDGAAARRRGGHRPAGAARPRPARGALRHRGPGERGGRPQPGRRGRRRGGDRPPAAARAGQGRQGTRRTPRPLCPRGPGRLALGARPPPARAQEVAPAQRRRGGVPQRPGRTPHPGGCLRRGQEVRRPGRAWPTRSAPTSCATPAPPTCSGGGPTSGWSKSSWATPRSPRPSATPRSRPSTSGGPTRGPIPVRAQREGGTA